jgi:GNAT superfamily N-acetyltransferase
MLFATSSLAARIDRSECDTTVAFAQLAKRRYPDVLLQPIGGATAVFAGPGEPFSKLVGLGFDGPLDADALGRVEREYDRRNAELRVELSTLADNSVGRLLTSRGYILAGHENVLGLELTFDVVARLDKERSPDVEVSPVAPGDARDWIRLVTEAFAHADTFDGPAPTEQFDTAVIERAFADVAEVPGMSMYVARRSGVAAGGGAVRLCDGLAMLSGAATLPAHRRHGVQSTLLRARLVDAARRGCDLAVVTTEPGSKSQQNVQKAGFTLLYPRAILIRPPKKGDCPGSGLR